MIISSLLFPRENLPHVSSIDTISSALDLMETHDLRCIPILDSSGQLYRGNIYKYHIYRHIAKGGSLEIAVTTLLKNATKFVYDTDAFYTLFFKLKDLPYIAVLNHDNHFLGVVRHDDFMLMLSQTWKINASSFSITVDLSGETNLLPQLIKLIKKSSENFELMTLDKDDFTLKKRVQITFSNTLTQEELNKLIIRLEKKEFSILSIENLAHGI
ncbi:MULTISPECIES: cyclic di-AMP binding protein CbpA [unclassified Granulicatella]|uniref:cyclic di-AMP binding protein CbpA n=1 Tax=unclassified Granulicatella TaxID=2630493 RepID=UPI001431A51A|nr:MULTISPECIES: cyclic di-AMP binding protein CbpA [unclassified Granulicatella]